MTGRGHLEQENAELGTNICWSLTKEQEAWPRAEGRAVQCYGVCLVVLIGGAPWEFGAG